MPGTSIRRIRGTLSRVNSVVLALVVATFVVVAIVMPWRSVWGVDNRTYVEQVSGVLHNGLPHLANGTPETIAEQRTAWNVPSGGRLWWRCLTICRSSLSGAS